MTCQLTGSTIFGMGTPPPPLCTLSGGAGCPGSSTGGRKSVLGGSAAGAEHAGGAGALQAGSAGGTGAGCGAGAGAGIGELQEAGGEGAGVQSQGSDTTGA